MIGTDDWCSCLQKTFKYQRISWLLQIAAIWPVAATSPFPKNISENGEKNLQVMISWVVVISTLWINACLRMLTFADYCSKKVSCSAHFTFAASVHRLWQIGQDKNAIEKWRHKVFCGFDFLSDLNLKYVTKCLLGISFLCCKLQQLSFLGYFTFAASLHWC